MGKACAHALKDKGPLLLCDVVEDGLREVADELRKNGADVGELICDVSDPSHINTVVETVSAYGGLGALVHTAGLSPTMAEGKRIYEVNLVGTALLLEALLPHAGEGSVAVCISSLGGHMTAFKTTPEINALLDNPLQEDLITRLDALGITDDSSAAYGYTKLGVQRLVINAAPEWGKRGARIVSISPGIFDTPMGRLELKHQKVMKRLISVSPLKRMGLPQEIAEVVTFVCSEKASFVTGVDWLVDGGATQALIRQLEA